MSNEATMTHFALLTKRTKLKKLTQNISRVPLH